MPDGLNPDEISRFRNDVERLAGGDVRLGLAVSGGPDSLAMLLLAHAAYGASAAMVATVDHGLRPEARQEATYVGQVSAALNMAHFILTPPAPITGSLQMQARKARYAALENWRVAQNLSYILTAHHIDDQVETLMMRLNRGSGVSGLAGIRARNNTVIRPLLGWRRAELRDIVERS
ncbi:MAG: tRNA lysidine(34) synthetase TilS, partial [Alphaproteobacteria bacterium]|nr:tRNA lysidine(34) synthetase TilS [Alphaproteobacteria bacterium]